MLATHTHTHTRIQILGLQGRCIDMYTFVYIVIKNRLLCVNSMVITWIYDEHTAGVHRCFVGSVYYVRAGHAKHTRSRF